MDLKLEMTPLNDTEFLLNIINGPTFEEIEPVFQDGSYNARLRAEFTTKLGTLPFTVVGAWITSLNPTYPTGCYHSLTPRNLWKFSGRCEYQGKTYYLIAQYDSSTTQGQALVTPDHPDLRRDEIYEKHGGKPVVFGAGMLVALALRHKLDELKDKYPEPIIFVDEAEEIFKSRNP